MAEKVLSQTEARVFTNHVRKNYRLMTREGFITFWRKTPEEVSEWLKKFDIEIAPVEIGNIVGRKA